MKKQETGNILCGLVGANSSTNGEYEASWLFPLFDHEKRADFDEKLAYLDAEKLPTREKYFWTHDKRTYLLVSDNDRWVNGDDNNKPDNTYKMTYKHKMGNRILFRRETNGYVKTSLLWRLFRYENDPEKGCKVDFLFVPVWR